MSFKITGTANSISYRLIIGTRVVCWRPGIEMNHAVRLDAELPDLSHLTFVVEARKLGLTALHPTGAQKVRLLLDLASYVRSRWVIADGGGVWTRNEWILLSCYSTADMAISLHLDAAPELLLRFKCLQRHSAQNMARLRFVVSVPNPSFCKQLFSIWLLCCD